MTRLLIVDGRHGCNRQRARSGTRTLLRAFASTPGEDRQAQHRRAALAYAVYRERCGKKHRSSYQPSNDGVRLLGIGS